MKNCYALFIGIDDYAADIPNLEGCVLDATRFHAYIQKNLNTATYQLHSKGLLSKTKMLPTRQNIITAINEHLGQAKEGDMALLFYAGHGSTEKAPPYFDETDGNFQTLVPCDARQIDPNTEKPTKNILDKELRYLFNKLWGKNKPEIIFIQDSCHSTGATRFSEKIKEVNKELEAAQKVFDQEENINSTTELVVAKARYTSPTDYERSGSDWTTLNEKELAKLYTAFDDEQCFINTLVENITTKQKSLDQLLPQAPHLHLAACGKQEYAYEVSPSGGVFTNTILKTLQAVGNSISYHDLFTRVRLGIAGAFDQSPSLHSYNSDSSQIHQPFLGTLLLQQDLTPYRSVDIFKGFHPVIYNNARGWYIPANEMTLLPALSDKIKEIPIEIFHYKKKPTGVSNAIITHVAAQYSLIQFLPQTTIPSTEVAPQLHCMIPAKYMRRWRTKIALENDSPDNPFKVFLKKNAKTLTYYNTFISWEQNKNEADYILKTESQGFGVYEKIEDELLALAAFKKTNGLSDKEGFQVVASLLKISKWLTVKNLYNNTQPQTLEDHVFNFSFNFYKDKQQQNKQQLSIKSNDSAEFENHARGEVIYLDAAEGDPLYFLHNANPLLEFDLHIEHQIGNKAVYYSTLLLNDNYGVASLQPALGCNLLPPQATAKLNSLVLQKPKQMIQFPSDQVEAIFYLKIFIAFSRFDIAGFLQKPLPAPTTYREDYKQTSTDSNRYKISKQPKTTEDTGMWACFTIPIVVQ